MNINKNKKIIAMLFTIIISSSASSQQIPDSLNIVINTLRESLRDVVEASA